MRRELQVEPLVLCLVQPAPSGTPVYKPRTNSDQQSKKNKNHNSPANKNQNTNKVNENIKQNFTNEEEEVTGRTRRRRSALTT